MEVLFMLQRKHGGGKSGGLKKRWKEMTYRFAECENLSYRASKETLWRVDTEWLGDREEICDK